MSDKLETIARLTTGTLQPTDLRREVNRFARELGWQPSDYLDGSSNRAPATAHLVVEHGLENTAVISFLARPFSDLAFDDRRDLLSLSYNNLVDWHIAITNRRATYVFNRGNPYEIVADLELTPSAVSDLRSDAFDQIVGRRPSPNIPALDDALIQTLSHWKRFLAAELGTVIRNESLSALFNAIIFARAVEDHGNRNLKNSDARPGPRILEELWGDPDSGLGRALVATIDSFCAEAPPAFLLDPAHLDVFNTLDPHVAKSLITDFYQNKFADFYQYDFAVMSKHALSRIYEHYVSLLRTVDSSQLSLLPEIPYEVHQHSAGSIYTPEFIARFFGRFLQEHISPSQFRRLRPIDPACGSGIFLRTLLEAQCDPNQNLLSDEDIGDAFSRVVGIDIDENAAQATRLSLALLHMVLTNGHFPSALSVHAAESFAFLRQATNVQRVFDVVIANPPFVSIEKQPSAVRDQIAALLGGHGFGRTDTYVAFLYQSLRLLRPGGFGLFVVPHSFLLSESARVVRRLLSERCIIHFVVDLSGVRVFANVDTYVILLGFQLRGPHVPTDRPATAVRAQEMVGKALHDMLSGKTADTPYYSIYPVSQEQFKEPKWLLRSPAAAALAKRLTNFPTLADIFTVRLGFITGADKVFIVPRNSIPVGESKGFVPYLPDREIGAYTVPSSTSKVVFYPYHRGKRLEEAEVRERFPQTWAYLKRHRKQLTVRRAVENGSVLWWRPERSRPPENMLRPKIVSPNLVVVPRFALDTKGRYAVSRAPLMYPLSEGAELDLMRFYLGVLNSAVGFWHIMTTSHRYSQGYAKLEPKTLRGVPVPDIQTVDPSALNAFIGLVERRMGRSDDPFALDESIDEAVAGFYGMTTRERNLIGGY